MHGKIIKFKGVISNFKVKDGVVKIQLAADIAFEHFGWSFWDVTKEHENETN